VTAGFLHEKEYFFYLYTKNERGIIIKPQNKRQLCERCDLLSAQYYFASEPVLVCPDASASNNSVPVLCDVVTRSTPVPAHCCPRGWF
jgi:hypothetical protein